MKQISLLICCLWVSLGLYAQAPQAFNYQGVARNAGGAPLSNQAIQLRLSIQSISGVPFYVEKHSVQTNALGLYALQIGRGTVLSGTFADIPWSLNTQYLKVEMDPAGGTNFVAVGDPTQLVSVPYALEAQHAGSALMSGDVSGVSEANTVEGLQNRPLSNAPPANGDVLKWNGSQWKPAADATSGGGAYNPGPGISISGNTISNTGDLDAGNELQTLSLNGNKLSLSDGGGTVTLPGGSGGTNYWQSAGGSDIINTNSGTVFLGGPAVPFQTLFASANNASQTLVAQNGGSGTAIYAEALNGAQAIEARGGTYGVTAAGVIGIRGANVGPVGGYGVFGETLTPNGTGGTFRNDFGGTGLEVIGGIELLTRTSSGPGYIPVYIAGVPDETAIRLNSRIQPTHDNSYNFGSPAFRWMTLYATNGTINTSDARQKQAIQPISYGLAQVLSMKPVSFEWKANPRQGRKLGFLAQDLQKVVPEVVADQEWIADEQGRMSARPAESLGVYYSDLIPVLAKAIQEQQALIHALQEHNKLLVKRLEILEQK